MFWVKHWCPRNSQEESFLFFFFFFLFLEQNRVVLLLQILVVCTNFAPFFLQMFTWTWNSIIRADFKVCTVESAALGLKIFWQILSVLALYFQSMSVRRKKACHSQNHWLALGLFITCFPLRYLIDICVLFIWKKKKNHLFRFVTKVYILVDKRNGMFPPQI